jgi:hypothetical protein
MAKSSHMFLKSLSSTRTCVSKLDMGNLGALGLSLDRPKPRLCVRSQIMHRVTRFWPSGTNYGIISGFSWLDLTANITFICIGKTRENVKQLADGTLKRELLIPTGGGRQNWGN